MCNDICAFYATGKEIMVAFIILKILDNYLIFHAVSNTVFYTLISKTVIIPIIYSQNVFKWISKTHSTDKYTGKLCYSNKSSMKISHDKKFRDRN